MAYTKDDIDLGELEGKRVCWHEVRDHEICTHKSEDGCFDELIELKDIRQFLADKLNEIESQKQ